MVNDQSRWLDAGWYNRVDLERIIDHLECKDKKERPSKPALWDAVLFMKNYKGKKNG